MATYIDLNSLSEEQIQLIVKKRVVREFADAFNAEQRGEEPRITTDALRPFYKQALSKSGGGDRATSDTQKDLMTLGRRLLRDDMERTRQD